MDRSHAEAADTASETESTAPVAIAPGRLDWFGHVEVELALAVGSTRMRLDRLLALKVGDCVPMDEDLNAPVTVLLDDKPFACGELVVVDEKLGVRIARLL